MRTARLLRTAALLIPLFLILWFYYVYASNLVVIDEGVWRAERCYCGSRTGCYSPAARPEQCGACFACDDALPPPPTPKPKHKTDELVFAFATEPKRRAKLLILIGSIHKFYPETKIIIYESGRSINDEESVRLLRNVQLRRWPDEFVHRLHPQDQSAFYIEELIGEYKNVFWLNDEMEWKDGTLLEYLGALGAPLTLVGSTSTESPIHLGFSPYFPGKIAGGATNHTAIFARSSARKLLYWVTWCFRTPSCSSCSSAPSSSIPCLPFLLSRLSADFGVARAPLPPCLAAQRWGVPGCDAHCTLKLAAGAALLFSSVALGTFYASNQFISKKAA